jgi:putative ABC transport system permease protein
METIGQDVRSALRAMLARPAFTLMVIVTLGLGVGANTAIFSLVNALLLRPLPFDEPEQLVALYERNVVGDERRMAVAPGMFLDWQQGAASFEQMSAFTTRMAGLAPDAANATPERVGMCMCSGNIFSMLRVSPALGRTFRPDEDRFGASRVAVISFDIWHRQFGGAVDVVGRHVSVDNEPYEVIGVAPSGFTYPNRDVQVWLPLLSTLPPQQQIRHDLHTLRVAARLHAGVSMEQALAEVDTIAARYKAANPQVAASPGATILRLHDDLLGDARRQLTILFGAVLCVLLIACLNIANLMLTRAAGRSREIGIRTALGAGRARIIRQLVTESALLGLAGGAVGGLLAFWLANLLAARAPGVASILPSDHVPVDLSVVLFAFGAALFAGLAVGLVPAMRSARICVTADLKDSRGAIGNRGHGRFRDVLIGAEVALSLVLVTLAGLLVHSFARLSRVEPGVRTDNVLTMGTALAGSNYREAAKRSAVLGELGDRLRAVPGVASAGLATCAPLTGGCNVLFFYIDGRPYVLGKFSAAYERSVDPGYFQAAGIPLLRGRTFTREDGVGFDPRHPRPGQIVISESMAKQHFPGEDPLGRRVFFDFEVQREKIEGFPAPRYEIVGIVGDVRPSLQDDVGPMLYRPMLDIANRGVAIILHTKVEPQSVAGAAREEIRRLDPTLAVFQVQTMDDLIGRSTSNRRFNMLLVVSFAALAALLAALGLYGVVSYAVSQRTSEIGLRMALGATNASVRRMMVMQGLKPAIVGIVSGLVAAASSTQVVQSLLFGITPNDPVTFLIAPPLLLTLAALACYLPARQATRLDPTIALRAE